MDCCVVFVWWLLKGRKEAAESAPRTGPLAVEGSKTPAPPSQRETTPTTAPPRGRPRPRPAFALRALHAAPPRAMVHRARRWARGPGRRRGAGAGPHGVAGLAASSRV